MTRARLLTGDAPAVLETLPAGSVRCCVTSPPYWGLRDYGEADQLGLEPTPEAYVARLVAVFRAVRRVLTDDGTLWLNLGDSYARAGGWSDNSGLDLMKRGESGRPHSNIGSGGKSQKLPASLKEKDLVGIPWRVAFALQADGWWLRSDIIWAKPNPMPESVTDRPTKAHEYVFLLSKSARYYYDAAAVAEDAFGKSGPYFGSKRQNGTMRGDIGRESQTEWLTRNARTVWEIATQPYPEAHFATFPPELPRRCIAAGSSQRGQCPTCRAPWVRQVELGRVTSTGGGPGRAASGQVIMDRGDMNTGKFVAREHITTGWSPSCGCGADPVPDAVLDPFGGSGTVAAVATGMGRAAISIDLNPAYQDLARQRIGPLLVDG